MPLDEPPNTQPPEYELQKTPDETFASERPGGSSFRWLLVIGLIAAAGAGAYFALARRTPPPPANQAAAAPKPATDLSATQPLGGLPEPVVLPPLEQSDALVADLVKRLSSHPTVAAFLATKGLIRAFTVSVVNIADGQTPAMHLRALKPPLSFRIVEEGESTYVDPRSFARYDHLAAAVESIDPAGAARLYATLKPRIEEAYRELGRPDTTFDRTLERALVQLLETPVPPAAIALRRAPKGIGYAFDDPGLENLTAAQRQFIRMGPGNMRRIRASLREIALALGIPATRLPTTL